MRLATVRRGVVTVEEETPELGLAVRTDPTVPLPFSGRDGAGSPIPPAGGAAREGRRRLLATPSRSTHTVGRRQSTREGRARAWRLKPRTRPPLDRTCSCRSASIHPCVGSSGPVHRVSSPQSSLLSPARAEPRSLLRLLPKTPRTHPAVVRPCGRPGERGPGLPPRTVSERARSPAGPGSGRLRTRRQSVTAASVRPPAGQCRPAFHGKRDESGGWADQAPKGSEGEAGHQPAETPCSRGPARRVMAQLSMPSPLHQTHPAATLIEKRSQVGPR